MHHFTQSYLEGRTALITGGYAGIGLAVAHCLANSGAAIAIAARTPKQAVVEELLETGITVYPGSLDVRQTTSVEECVSQIEQQLGPVDILVNAAGITVSAEIGEHRDRDWDDVIDTNLSGCYRTIKRCLPSMKRRNWGRIINIGSTAARVAVADHPAYCASKSGLLGLTRAVALEGAAFGVTCTMVSPTWVETDMLSSSMLEYAKQNNTEVEHEKTKLASETPQKRLVQPGEIAALVAFLCRDEAMGITMEDIQVNAGALW